MPYPSLFYKIDIKPLKLADKIRCASSDKYFLVQIDVERQKTIKQLDSRDATYAAALKQIDCYLAVYASYLAFAKQLNDKQDKELFQMYYPSEFEYVHCSPLTQVKISAKPAQIERYLFNLYYIMITLDAQLYRMDKVQMMQALSRIDYMRQVAPNITVEGQEFMDFKTELLDVFEHLFYGMLLLMAASNAEIQNDEAAEYPPYTLRYTYNLVAGIYTHAVQEFELIYTQIVYYDPKNKRLQLPKEFQLFVAKLKAVAAMCMYVYMVLEFEINPYSYGNAQEQSLYCRTRLAVAVEQFQQSTSQFEVFNAFFTRNFKKSIEAAYKYQFKGKSGDVIRFPIQCNVKRSDPFVDFEPSWTQLKPAK